MKRSCVIAASLTLVIAGWSLPAMAHIVVPESGDTFVSAYNLGAFSLSFDAQIEDSTTIPHTSVTAHNNYRTDVDWFRFSVDAGSSLHLDIDTDNWGGLFDTTMALWDPVGNLMAQSDDFGYDPGSTYAGLYYYNSQIYSTAFVTGTYYVSVSDYANFATGFSPFGSYGSSGYYGTGGAYDLHISASTPSAVPEPATATIWSLLCGIGVCVRSQRRKRAA